MCAKLSAKRVQHGDLCCTEVWESKRERQTEKIFQASHCSYTLGDSGTRTQSAKTSGMARKNKKERYKRGPV